MTREETLRRVATEIADNEEVVITSGPVNQLDANEPRARMVISGPARLVDALTAFLTKEENT